jgi:hypothetical protein
VENLKVNILRSLDLEHASVYRFLDECFEILDDKSQKTLEVKIAHSLFNAMDRWADARLDMHKALTQMIRIATERKTDITKGYAAYASDTAWVTQTGYERAITETNKWEQEIVTLTHLINLDANDRIRIFAKLTSLIKF